MDRPLSLVCSSVYCPFVSPILKAQSAPKPMTKTQADQLEAIIDSYGLEMTLHTISDICHDKASHILENWQDSPLAKEWDKIGRAHV